MFGALEHSSELFRSGIDIPLDQKSGEEIIGIWEDMDMANETFVFDPVQKSVTVEVLCTGQPEMGRWNRFVTTALLPFLRGHLVFSGVDDFKIGDEEVFTMLHGFSKKGNTWRSRGINWIEMTGQNVMVRLEQGSDRIGHAKQWRLGPLVLWTSYSLLNSRGNVS